MLYVKVLVFLLEKVVDDVGLSSAERDHAILDQNDAQRHGEILPVALGLVLFVGRDTVDYHVVILVRFATGSFINVQRVGYRFDRQLEVLGKIVQFLGSGIAGVYPGVGLDLLGLDECALFGFVDLQHYCSSFSSSVKGSTCMSTSLKEYFSTSMSLTVWESLCPS